MAEHPGGFAGGVNVLGIETSCDETAVAVLRGERDVLASVVSSQAALHERYGGVVPEEASRAHVQAIKRPTLLEFAGPLFMSYPVSSNLQYRLSEEPGGTLIKFRHLALGLIEEDHRKGVVRGWASIHARVKAAAERGKPH